MHPLLAIWIGNGFYRPAAARLGPACFWTLDALQWVALPGLLVWLLASRCGVTAPAPGFERRSLTGLQLAWTRCGVAASCGTAVAVAEAAAARALGWPADAFSYAAQYPTGPARIPVWLYSAATAGVVESGVFLGAPWLVVQPRTASGRLGLAGGTDVLFAMSHWERGIPGVLAAAAFQTAAEVWFVRFGSLWPIAVGYVLVDLWAFARGLRPQPRRR